MSRARAVCWKRGAACISLIDDLQQIPVVSDLQVYFVKLKRLETGGSELLAAHACRLNVRG